MNLPNNTLLQGGKYKITRYIASGGFGCTYEAEHVMLGRRVAIKEFFVKDFCNRDENTSYVTVGTQSKKPLVNKLKKKFLDEARAIGGLSHPGIVTVTDVFEENGTAYFVMGYIDGCSVADMLKRVDPRTRRPLPLPEAEAVKYIRQVCNALEYVHRHNRLHLDIKPGNIMVDSYHNAVLIDFGASKQYDEESGENTSTLVGKTPGYAPLEQMGNSVVHFSAATDIYALGATLYKMLTGVTPPESTLLASGVTLPPLPDSLSDGVKAAVYQAMKPQIDLRPQTIAEFVALLDGDNEYTLTDMSQGNRAEPTVTSASEPTQTTDKTNTIPKKRKSATSKKKKSAIPKMLLAAAVAIIAVLVIGVVVLNNHPTTEPTSITPEPPVEEVPAKVHVDDKEFTNANGLTFRFTGDVVGDALPTGTGTGKYAKGTYTGDYVNGIRQGNGEFKDLNNGIFKGSFNNDQYSEGTYTYDAASYFTGTFKNDEPYNGDYYENNQKVGKYVNGQLNWL